MGIGLDLLLLSHCVYRTRHGIHWLKRRCKVSSGFPWLLKTLSVSNMVDGRFGLERRIMDGVVNMAFVYCRGSMFSGVLGLKIVETGTVGIDDRSARTKH